MCLTDAKLANYLLFSTFSEVDLRNFAHFRRKLSDLQNFTVDEIDVKVGVWA